MARPANVLSTLAPGVRVVVRSQAEGGLTDTLGTLVAVADGAVTVDTRRGRRVVALSDVVAAKQVPPAPVRRGAPHMAVSMTDLERVAVPGWPPLESAWLGEPDRGWLLRAGGGYTGRANSVLPLGDPGLPAAAAVAAVEDWYAARRLPARFCLFGPEGFSVGEDALGPLLLARGYSSPDGALVMTSATARLAELAGLAGPAGLAGAAGVESGDGLTDEWLSVYAARRPGDDAVMRTILTGSPSQLFLGIRDGGMLVAVGRVAVAHGWAGLSAVHVLSDHRRRGLATRLAAAAGAVCRARGIPSMYVQVSPSAEPAVALYRALGFQVHHEYAYLVAGEE